MFVVFYGAYSLNLGGVPVVDFATLALKEADKRPYILSAAIVQFLVICGKWCHARTTSQSRPSMNTVTEKLLCVT